MACEAQDCRNKGILQRTLTMGTSRLRFGPPLKRKSKPVLAQACTGRYAMLHVQVYDKRSMRRY